MSELDLLADCLKDATKERDELAAALEQANAREREAFMAGIEIFAKHVSPSRASLMDWDDEQAWQQYRCQDDTDWKTVDDDTAKAITESALGTAGDRLPDDGEGQAAALSEIDR